jgi:hypothetical protein
MASLTFKLRTVAFLLLLSPPIHGQSGKRFVLLPESETSAISHLCSRNGPKVGGSWQPTEGDVELLESHLSRISKLKSEDGLVGIHISKPSRYYRQYVGIVIGGRKLIYLNAFSTFDEKPPADWRERLVVGICDGGPSAWGVLYDPETKEFSQLSTNEIA